MATPRVRRLLVGVSVVGLAAALAPIAMPIGAVAAPRPTAAQVQRDVDALHHQAEQASEAYNTAQVELGAVAHQLTVLRAQERRQAAAVAALQNSLGRFAAAQYRTSGLGQAAQLALSDKPDDIAQGIATVSALGLHQESQLRRVRAAREELRAARAAVAEQVSAAASLRKHAATDQGTINARLADAEALLAQLSAADRARMQARNTTANRASRSQARTPIFTGPASGRAAVAVRTAFAQLGDPYVFGAAGPSAFDCSGLTSYAWRAAGVYLPHSSSAQYGYGRHVSRASLQPGDLVFFYSPISHVGIYIGGGRIIHAPFPGRSVETISISTMPYAGATRL